MSYFQLQPAYYQMLTPQSPWHAGSEGWTKAPWVTWGDNPNLVGPPRQGVAGLGGCGPCAAAGLGDALMDCTKAGGTWIPMPGGGGICAPKKSASMSTARFAAPSSEAAASGPWPTWAWALIALGVGGATYLLLRGNK